MGIAYVSTVTTSGAGGEILILSTDTNATINQLEQ
jgi:hypothetical protein